MTDRVIGVFDSAIPPGVRRDIDPPFRVGVRTVVGSRHDVRENGFARLRRRADLPAGQLKKIFIGYPPDVFVVDLFFRKCRPVYHPVAVVAEEITHIIEIAVTAINETGLISFAA
ncbi:hypothetical protein D3C87_1525020 [compost metagenome]